MLEFIWIDNCGDEDNLIPLQKEDKNLQYRQYRRQGERVLRGSK